MGSKWRSILAACLAIILAGCTGSHSKQETVDLPQTAAFTVGTIGAASPTKSSYINMKAIVEEAGGRLISEEYDSTPEGSITAVEKLIANHCDGIIFMPLSDSSLSFMVAMCEESGVYWTIRLRSIQDNRIRQLVEASPYFVGTVMEDEEKVGYNVMKTLGEQGVKKVAAFSTIVSDTTGAARERGMNLAAAEFGIEVVETIRDPLKDEDISRAVESLLNAYPDLDAIFRVGAMSRNISTIALNTLSESGKADKMQYATVDFESGLDVFFDRGMICVAAGGHSPLDASISAALLANTLMGTPLNGDGPVTLKIDPLMIQSGDELRRYFEVVEDGTAIFSAEAAKQNLFKWINPDITAESFQELVDSYSSDTVLDWKNAR